MLQRGGLERHTVGAMGDGRTITPVSAAAHVFVGEGLSQPRLEEPDRHHLTRVLRLKAGVAVTACDGRGGWVPCRLGSDGGLEPVGEVVREAPPTPEVTVAFALTKGERPDLVVQKLTELGVDRLVPFAAERSVVRWDAVKAAKHHDRFVELVRQAAMQSRRVILPSVGLASVSGSRPSDGSIVPGAAVPSFGEVAAALGPRVVMADMAGESPVLARPAVLIGPEGGWSPAERDTDVPRMKLGVHVMRAETAAITAGAMMVALRSDIVSAAVPSGGDF